MTITPSRSAQVSPGRPTIRLTKVPPAPQRSTARGGVRKNTTSPLPTPSNGHSTRSATTRSDRSALQPGSGFAHLNVRSIPEEGIRYSFSNATNATARTTAETRTSAKTTVRIRASRACSAAST